MNCICGYYFIRHICYNCGNVDERSTVKDIPIFLKVKKPPSIKKSDSQYVKKRKRIFDRDGNKCLKCSFTPEDLPKNNKSNWLTIDHVVPKSKGGTNLENNLQTLCRKCNFEKGNKNSNDYRIVTTNNYYEF